MALYFGDTGILNVPLGTTKVERLPFDQTVVLGVAAPAAAPGTKTFASTARCRVKTYANVSFSRNFDGRATAKSGLTGDLDNGRVPLDGLLANHVLGTRAELTSFPAPSLDVVYVGAGTVGSTTGTVSPGLPTRQVGDLLIAFWTQIGSGWLFSVSSGWTLFKNGGGIGYSFALYWRWATNDANDNMTFTMSNNDGTTRSMSQMYSFRNVDTTDQFLDFGFVNSTEEYVSLGSAGYQQAGTAPTTTKAIMSIGGYYNQPDPPVYAIIPKRAHILTICTIRASQTNASPTLTNNVTVSPANTTNEANTFPYTLISHTQHASGGYSLDSFHSGPMTTAIDAYNATADYNYTVSSAPQAAYVVATSVFLRPIGAFNNYKVYLDGIIKAKASGVTTLYTSANSKNLDGILTCHVTPTCDLHVIPGVHLDGILTSHVTASAILTTVSNRMDGVLHCRSVANAVLSIGTTHKPAGLLKSKATASAILTTNYMQALLKSKVTTFLNLSVDIRLASSMAARVTASGTFQVLRLLQSSIAARVTANATLKAAYAAAAAVSCRVTATASLQALRRLVGAAGARSTASMKLDVQRVLQASVGARTTASCGLTAPRLLSARLRASSTAGATLAVDHRLAGLGRVHCSMLATLSMGYPVTPPVGIDVTVTPDEFVLEDHLLPVEVEVHFDDVSVDEE